MPDAIVATRRSSNLFQWHIVGNESFLLNSNLLKVDGLGRRILPVVGGRFTGR